MSKSDKNEPVVRPLSRRALLKLLAGMGLSVGGLDARSDEAAGMRARPIPSSGEMLPVVGLGTARSFDVDQAGPARSPLREVLDLFVRHQGRLVDTSPMYGRAETVIGDLAADLRVRDKLFLATKVWTSGREAGIAQMQRSMERLRAKRLDLIQVHNLVDWRTQLATLRQWKEQGRVRYLGITHYLTSAFDDLERVMQAGHVDSVQLNYSIVTREAERWMLPLAADKGVAVIVNRPFEKGTLFRAVRGRPLPPWAEEIDCSSWGQLFLKYILSHPAVTCVIPATGNPEHLVDNMAAGLGRLPDAAMRSRMAALAQSL